MAHGMVRPYPRPRIAASRHRIDDGRRWRRPDGRGAHCISICPDDPQGLDDPDCRYIVGVLFGHAMGEGEGVSCASRCRCRAAWSGTGWLRGAMPCSRTTAPALRCTGPGARSTVTGCPPPSEALRDDPPLKLCMTLSDRVPPEKLVTEIYSRIRAGGGSPGWATRLSTVCRMSAVQPARLAATASCRAAVIAAPIAVPFQPRCRQSVDTAAVSTASAASSARCNRSRCG